MSARSATIEEHQFDLLRCEKSAFDIDHCEAGAWLMERWGFPNELREVAAFHHREPNKDTSLLVTVVYIAWQLADMFGLSPMSTRSAMTITEITATLEPAAQAEILSKLEGLPELVAEKLNDAESAAGIAGQFSYFSPPVQYNEMRAHRGRLAHGFVHLQYLRPGKHCRNALPGGVELLGMRIECPPAGFDSHAVDRAVRLLDSAA